MHSFIKKGLFIAAAAGILVLADKTDAAAADIMNSGKLPINMERVLEKTEEARMEENKNKEEIQIEKTDAAQEEVVVQEQKGKYLDMAFADTESENILVRSAPSQDSEWVGKLYAGSAMTVLGPVGEWTAVQSGNVKGFVETKSILVGKDARQKARQMEAEALKQNKEVSFSYGETKEEEAARLKREEEERRRQEEEKKRQQGQAVVDYAKQFIGNPYVWGGTSLTNGADCSGFVQSVYRHFGFSLPRTSTAQRSAGRAVSYSEARPGDIICYQGHVGIYAGNGQIVNAQDPAHGIGMSPAAYTSIVTVRRMF